MVKTSSAAVCDTSRDNCHSSLVCGRTETSSVSQRYALVDCTNFTKCSGRNIEGWSLLVSGEEDDDGHEHGEDLLGVRDHGLGNPESRNHSSSSLISSVLHSHVNLEWCDKITGNRETRNHSPYTLHPTPCTLHPAPYTLHPAPYTLHPTPYTLHPTP